MEIYVDDEAKLTLHGLKQHYVKLKDEQMNRKLFELLDVLEFNQVRYRQTLWPSLITYRTVWHRDVWAAGSVFDCPLFWP